MPGARSNTLVMLRVKDVLLGRTAALLENQM